MGRPGGGGRSGGRSSSGHRSSSRSSGGHRMGGGRPGGGSRSYRSSSSGGGGGFRFGGPSFGPRIYRRGYGGTVVRFGGPSTPLGCIAPVFLTFFAVIVIALAMFAFVGSNSVPASTENRAKVETGVAYDNNCVIDQVGWFSNVPRVERELKGFYDETGVQPYVVFVNYKPELATDADKEAYANEWYEENIDNEGTFLYMYFAEEDADNDMGYSVYVNGNQVGSVMDAEAVDIFWAYLDQYWYSDLSMDDVIVKTFDNTADRIMRKTATSVDLGITVAVVVGVVVAGVIIIRVIKLRQARAREKAAETERILNTPLDGIDDDPIAKKYEKGEDGR